MYNIIIRFISLLTIFLLFFLIIGDNPIYFFIMINCLFIISFIECFQIKYKKKKSIIIFIFLITLLIFICKYKYYISFFPLILFLLFIFQFYLILKFDNEKIINRNKIFIIMIIYISCAFISIFNIWFWHDYKLTYNFFLIAILIASFNDMFAYLGGTFFGKNKLSIKVSPNKTYQGFAIGCIIFLLIIFYMKFIIVNKNIELFEQISILDLFYLCTFSIFIVPIGDLIISLFKRIFIIKDTGRLLPGHGGILDRIDSIIPLWVCICIYIKLSQDYIYILNI